MTVSHQKQVSTGRESWARATGAVALTEDGLGGIDFLLVRKLCSFDGTPNIIFARRL